MVVVVFVAEILQGEAVVDFFVDADGKGGVDVVGGDLREEFLAEGVEGADDGDSVTGGGAHGEVGLVAFALAVVLFVAFNVDYVRDVRGHEAFRSFGFVVYVEIFIENGICGICFGDSFSFELLEQT